MVSPKISNLLLKIGTTEVLDGVTIHHPLVMGMKGWQWIFLLEGLPSVALGVLVLFYLPDGPAQARWLTSAERTCPGSD